MRNPRFLIGALCFVALAVATTAGAQDAPPTPLVTSRGSGEAVGPAARAILAIGVDTRGDDVAQASRENTEAIARVRNALINSGIAAEQITTRGYVVSINERGMLRPLDMRSVDTSRFIVRNMLRVEVRQVDRVGSVVEAALGAGATNVQAAQYEPADENELRQRAIAAAVAEARRAGETMARAAGGTLGRLLEVSNAGFSGVAGGMARTVDMLAPAGYGGSFIYPRDITVRADVVMRWELVLPR